MEVSQEQLIAVLSQFNPWWRRAPIPDLPSWRRAAFQELLGWMQKPPAHRAVLLSGARQVGKTTLILQAVQALLEAGVPPANILYTTFDHPLLKLARIDATIEAWRAREARVEGVEFVLVDEAQYVTDWGTWVKHQVDFTRQRRVVFTGSAAPLLDAGHESGVGRWHTIRLTTLSFYEYLKIRSVALPELPPVASLTELFSWDGKRFRDTGELALPYVAHFHEYLIRGGFPQTALVESVTQAQRLVREDIIDKVLKRDMTAIFGVRRVLDLERTFLYLCLHSGDLLDMQKLCENLEVKRPTVERYLDLLEATHLIYRLPPHGYGKSVLRARFKVYLADAAMAPAVLLRGKSILEDPSELGIATETATFKHLVARYYPLDVRFTYWRGKKDHEVDLVAEMGKEIVPFEVKYRMQHTGPRDIKGLLELCAREKSIKRGYLVTKALQDLGPMERSAVGDARLMRIPAALLCYWMGASELRRPTQLD